MSFGAARALIKVALAVLAMLPTLVDAVAGDGTSEASHFDPETGYRMTRFRAPVMDDVPGATRISYDDVADLVKNRSAVLLDVMAAEGGGPDPDTGRWRITKPRQHIPGSHWLPDVGKGVLNAGLEAYFKANLERLSSGDKARPLIIYCVADCWMGWNATKRAVGHGYSAVYWYPEGTDGWRDWDGTLAPAMPVAMQPHEVQQCVPSRMPDTK